MKCPEEREQGKDKRQNYFTQGSSIEWKTPKLSLLLFYLYPNRNLVSFYPHEQRSNSKSFITELTGIHNSKIILTLKEIGKGAMSYDMISEYIKI